MNPSHLFLPEGRKGQSLAFGVPLALAVIISFGVLKPLFHCYQTRNTKIAIKQAEISRIADMRPLIPGMRQQLAALQATAGDPEIFLAGESDAVASANLQSAIQSLASQSNANLASTTILPVQPVRGLHQIAINVNLTASWKTMIALLGAIDLAHPRMIVSDLNITDSGQAEDAPLQISFTVTAFRASATP